jgi:hypothetical protein
MGESYYLSPTCRGFNNMSVSEKILNTIFLLTIGIGYLVAVSHVYLSHNNQDGKPGFSVEDVMIKYHGSPEQTKLGVAINGIMASNLKQKKDREVILRWIKSGAREAEYQDHIAPILNRDCIGCHTRALNPSLPDLTHFSGVEEVAKVDGGASLPYLIQVSHIHLFGIAFILFFIGKIFLLCEINVTFKRVMMVMPFAAMLTDIMSWFATRLVPDFAYVVVATGILMGFCICVQIGVSIYQMWFYPAEIRPI